MPTINKEFHFANSTEGWTDNTKPVGTSNFVLDAGAVEAWHPGLSGVYRQTGTYAGKPSYNKIGEVASFAWFAVFWDGSNWYVNHDDQQSHSNADVPYPWEVPTWDVGVDAAINSVTEITPLTPVMAWYPPHQRTNHVPQKTGRARNAGMLNIMGGSLRTSAGKNVRQAENCWEWYGTFEDLGVPTRSTVTAISGDYLWRRTLRATRPSFNSDAVWSSTDFASGPLELCDDGGAVISTLSARSFVPPRASGGDVSYPIGNFDDAVSLTPGSWALVSGSPTTVSVPSSVPIRLRLRSLTPATGDGHGTWIRFKQDFVNLSVTYTLDANKFYSPNSFLFSQ